MIKCNVTIIGRVFRAPEIKNDREGNPFVTFGVSTELKDNGETRDIDISVACDGEDDNVLGLSSGDRVKVKGVLRPAISTSASHVTARMTTSSACHPETLSRSRVS